MFRRILTVALVAGALAGIGISVVQEFTTTPIILHAEEFEATGQAHKAAVQPDNRSGGRFGAALFLVHGEAVPASSAETEAWGPDDGLERTLYTTLANIISGVAFGLILAAAFALHGGTVDGRRGVIWGMAGFAVFTLGPGLGLPPEVPGSMAAELVARQTWWLFAAASTAAGLALMVFGRGRIWVLAGVLALVVPHAVGAPQPAEIGGAVPPELAGHFAAASLVTSAIFWSMLGWLAGTMQARLDHA